MQITAFNRLNSARRTRRNSAVRLAVLTAAGLLPVITTHAAEPTLHTQYWIGGTGNWTNANLWSPTPGLHGTDPVQEPLYPNNTAEFLYVANLYGGGTATIQAGEAITVSRFYLGGNTTLDGAGSLEVLGDFQWVGGNMTGGGALTVSGDVDLTFAQQNARSNYRPITTHGTVNFTGGTVYLNNAGDWNSYGTFNLGGTSGISKSVGNATFHNRGTFNKTGANAVRMESLAANHGTMNVHEGKLTFTNNFTNNGTIAVAAGATLSFSTLGPATTHAPTSSIVGEGAVEFLTGTHNLPSYQVAGPVTFSGGASVTFNNTITPSSLGDLYGTVNFNAAQTFPTVRIVGATVGGAGDMEITSNLHWVNGSITGTGTTTLAAGATANLVGNNTVLHVQRPFVNNGTLTHDGTGIAINYGASITNNGTFNAVKGGMSRSSGAATVHNPGTFRKTSASTYTIGDNIAFNNTGSLFVDEGTLELAANFSNTGTMTFAPGTKLRLTANTFTGAAGSSLTGDVPVQVTGGNHTFADAGAFAVTGPLSVTAGNVTLNGAYSPAGDLSLTGGTLTLNAATTLNNLTLSSALSGAGAVTVKGTTTWTSASVNPGGTLVFDTGSALNLTGIPSTSHATNRNVETRGTTSWTGGSILVSGATWLNTGDFTAADTTSIGRIGAAGVFRNDATFTKTGASTLQFETLLSLDNRGTFNLTAGKLQIGGGGENRGAITLAEGTTLTFTGSTFTGRAGSTLGGPGNVTFTGSSTHTFEAGAFVPTGAISWGYGTTVNINNPITPAVLGPIDGTVNFNADQAFPNLTLTGTIGGTGTVNVTSAFNFPSGTIKSSVVLDQNMTWEVLTSGTRTISGSLRTGALTRLAAGQITLSGGKLINGGTFELAGGQLNNTGTGARFENVGTLLKTGSNTITIPAGVTVDNKGIVDVQAGTLALSALHADQVGNTFGGSGSWIVRNGATLTTLASFPVKTNTSTIILEGPTSAFPQLNSLDNNQGYFEIRAGRHFTTAGNLANSALIKVGESSTLKLAGSLANTGQILLDGSMIFDYTGAAGPTADAVRQQLLLGSTTGGSQGIYSVAAAVNGHRSLAYIEAATLLNLTGTQTATWGGLPVDATAVLVLSAVTGDANLDGAITPDDYALVDRGRARSLTGWTNGDFNYDNTVDANDYLAIDRTYLSQGKGFDAALLARRQAEFGDAYVSQLLASVPEPSTLATVALSAGLLGARRRRFR